ncbi:MAG TPA: SusD/RagB family nutrient-binding outer membrane lipoprotein [Puia sp.]|nr:SusD/RagB family nutrient-binding outer membrane lipoprotein [Puia sp.]
MNPKGPSSDIPATALFLQGEKSLVDVYTTSSVSTAPFRVVAQSWTENNYVYEAQYNFLYYQSPDGFWNYIYAGPPFSAGTTPPGTGVLNNLYAAKLAWPSQEAHPAVLRNDLIICDLLEIYAYDMLVATYGDIPYTQAENASIPFPKYDDQKTIYYDLLTRLDTCIAGLDVTSGSMGVADQIYGGNTASWLKFAATLKLKMALLIADVDAATAAQKVKEAVNTGVFGANADNALFTYDKSAPLNSNPLWNALVYSGRHDFVPTALLVNTMDSLSDPRLPLYVTQDPNGNYSGGIPGAGNGYGIFSDFSPAMEAPDYPGDILDYSETEFWLAEAAERGMSVAGSAETHYDNAITASIEFWGGTSTQAQTYLNQPTVAYSTAGGTWQQKIGWQSWIALYNGNWDTWTEIRRLGYPNLNVVSPPIRAQGNLPLRFTYPTNEQTSNSVNWNAAAKALPGGTDVVSAKLFWMP